MRYLRSLPGCSFLALSMTVVSSTASGEPPELPTAIADSIEFATDSLTDQFEQLFEERNSELLRVLKEPLAERVLELEMVLMHKDRRIRQLEIQALAPESAAEFDGEGEDGSLTTDPAIGREGESAFEEGAFEDDDASDASGATDTGSPVENGKYAIDGFESATRQRYEARRVSDETASEGTTGSFSQLARELERVIRDANEKLESEVFQVLESRNAELGGIFQVQVSGRIEDLEKQIVVNERRMERIRQTFRELDSLLTPSSSDETSTSKTYCPEGLFEPGVFERKGGSTVLQSAPASGSALREFESEPLEGASTQGVPLDLEEPVRDAIRQNDPASARLDAVDPGHEQSSIPIDDPNPTHPEVIPARVESLPKEDFPSEDKATADEAINEEEEPSTHEGPSNAEKATPPEAPLLPVPVGSDSRVCPYAKGERYTP